MIYECVPDRVDRIWGALPPVAPGGEPVGEIWWFHGNTVLRTRKGESKQAASFFTGKAFPVILKTLHSSRDLSVQVHPGKNRRPPLKDESWVVLEGEGRILHGIRQGTSPEGFAQAVKNGTVEGCLETLRAFPGSLFHLPAGTVHALGGGLTVLEIQTSCPVTYRLWDYGRKDSSGNTRELHVEKGLDSVDWSRRGRAVQVKDEAATDVYQLRRGRKGLNTLNPMELLYDHGGGRCFFTPDGGEDLETTGETWIVRIDA